MMRCTSTQRFLCEHWIVIGLYECLCCFWYLLESVLALCVCTFTVVFAEACVAVGTFTALSASVHVARCIFKVHHSARLAVCTFDIGVVYMMRVYVNDECNSAELMAVPVIMREKLSSSVTRRCVKYRKCWSVAINFCFDGLISV